MSTVMGIGFLVVLVIVSFVVIDTLLAANLTGNENTTWNGSAYGIASNFSIGVSEIAGKVPTILLICAVVFLLGALVLLMRNTQGMGFGGGGSL